MRALLVVALLGGVASAQPSTVPAAPPAPAPPPSVMDRRWAIGLSLGWENVTIQTADKPKVTFGTLALAGRFRIRPTMEVALALWGGGTAGDIGLAAIFAEFRYRFYAERPWNFYALGSLGTVSVAQKMASSDEKKGRGSLRLGVGGERRLGAFGLAADIGITAVGENKSAPDPVMPSTATQLSRFGLGGAYLMIGVTYYF